jgi:S-adenosylmethionine/arginine decarboxylase-like enzyme
MIPYGFELILDLHDCDVSTFNRKSIKAYFIKLCTAIDMKRCKMHFWDDFGVPKEERQTSPHTKGTSAVQFILTSNITIHTLDILKTVYVNIFSCKPYDKEIAEKLTIDWFKAKTCRSNFIERL